MQYKVGVIIYNTIDINAETEEDAERQVREMSMESICEDSEFNVAYVEARPDE